ncbi:hypothetical protein D1831_04975 [Lactiplantibacillus garii]|uniref:Electron transfer flavoprotein alpha/beta-subunit N-terminal domain-containing protein n=1 Tax=Lactiplantibacillus garii TaxID=2306423 RepID=A0A3R8L1Z5_9LACO|nr:hypothetical protein [Lactiplantibacillus garii]RRK10911.1 hypothetical protein D1831_04975 [Lactiplantibacillus garii]
MKSLVFIKSVRKLNADPQLDAQGQVNADADVGINYVDKLAIEAGLQLAGTDGSVTVASYGDPQATESTLRDGLAMGATKAVAITSDLLTDQSNQVGLGVVLAEAAQQLGDYDVILTGDQAKDDVQGCVGLRIADALQLPYFDRVNQLTLNGDQLDYQLLWEHGNVNGSTATPAVISVTDTINKPRLPSFKTKMTAKRAAIDTVDVAKLTVMDAATWKKLNGAVVAQRFVPKPERPAAKIVNYDQGSGAAIDELMATLQQQNIL